MYKLGCVSLIHIEGDEGTDFDQRLNVGSLHKYSDNLSY